MTLPKTFAEAEMVLANALPNYEKRDQQGELARAIENSIATRTHLIGQGPVGIGKSLAYLIPAILSGKRTVVATATKALQDQLFFKDIPLLQEHLMPFKAALLKGRSNYLCVAALQDAEPSDVPHLAELLALVTPSADQDPALMDFPLNHGFSGERDDLPFEIENREWMKIAADSDNCRDFKCKDTRNCYGQMARHRALRAQIIVVNHSLYVSDLVLQEVSGGKVSMIGHHEVFIADEVHEFPEYATNSLGVTFKEAGMRFLAAEVRNWGKRWGIEVDKEVRALLTATDALWSVLEPGRIRFAHIEAHEDEFVAMSHALVDIQNVVRPASVESIEDQKANTQRKRLENRAVSASMKFGQFLTAPFTEIVRWVEMEKDRPTLKMAPIDVAPFLRDNIFGPGDVTAIMVSGTVAVSGSMQYMATTLGVDRHDSLIVESPFDFEAQSRLYLPDLPDPKEYMKWSAMSLMQMLELIRASKGRALLLFTSIREMNNAYDMIADQVPYTCLKQGQKPNKTLVEEFKADTHSILFGTRSFMTGIDIQGEALSLLILNKLTFPVPTEPMFEAKAELIESRGGSAFFDLSVPMMTLTLQQAFGRLIRSKTDRGVAVLLDPRVNTKNYGSGIIKSLPPMPQVKSLTEIEAWL